MACTGHRKVRDMGLAGPEISDVEIERRLMRAVALLVEIWEGVPAQYSNSIRRDSDDPFDPEEETE